MRSRPAALALGIDEKARGGVAEEKGSDGAAGDGRASGLFEQPFIQSYGTALLAFRILNGFMVQTYFNPDEYWQGPEVAHRAAFGTWEWGEDRLRGWLHPLIFAAGFKLIALFVRLAPDLILVLLRGALTSTPPRVSHGMVLQGLDSAWLVATLPRLMQSAVWALCDMYTYGIAKRLFGTEAAKYALFCQLANWFGFYCGVRTFSNSMEAALTTAALYYWPIGDHATKNLHQMRRNRRHALLLAAVSCILRPTSGALWMFLGVELMGRLARTDLVVYIAELSVVAVCAVLLSVGLDSYLYGELTVVPWNFIKFNVLAGHSELYGAYPWHWYVSQGFPAVAFSFIPLFLYGVTLLRKSVRVIGYLVLWTIFFLSLISHKEFRFLMPILPVTMIISGVGLMALHVRTRSKRTKGGFCYSNAFWIAAAAMLVTNVPFAMYQSLVHQRGPISTLDYLRSEASRWMEAGHDGQMRVTFLTNCHATPFYSQIHEPIEMDFLDCSPEYVRP